MSSLPCYRLTLRERSVRVAHTGNGTTEEVPSAIAVQYCAKWPRSLRVLAVGREAENLAEAIRQAEEKGLREDPPARLIERGRAVWWPLPERDVPLPFVPAEHDGECCILWPLTEPPHAQEVLEAMIRHLMARASAERWFFKRPVVEVDLPSSVSDAQYDMQVRALWGTLGRNKVVADGKPLALRGPRRTLRELPKEMRNGVLILAALWAAGLAMVVWDPVRGKVLLGTGGLIALSTALQVRDWLRS